MANPGRSDMLYIFDARPYKAAWANSMIGKGYENTDNYPHTHLEFLNIDNIHHVSPVPPRARIFL